MTGVVLRRIEEFNSERGGRLGRHVVHDPKSLSFPAEAASTLRDVAHSARGLPLAQVRGSCTGEAACGALDSQPNLAYRNGVVLVQKDADALYDQEIRDQGGDPAADDPGGSGLMVCRAARQMGLIRYYRHAFGLEHALRALVLRPVMFGTNWYEGFDRPDANGRVKISGRVRGGHEYVALRLLVELKLIGCAQSWGPGWGVGDPLVGMSTGVFYVGWDDMDRLLGEQGDCTVPYV